MEQTEAAIFFDQMMEDLNEGNLSRKSEMVKFFKKYDTNPNPTKSKIIQTWLNYALVDACKNGHVNVAEFLLIDKDLPSHADIHFNKDECLISAAKNNHFNMVKFLLASPKLKEKSDIYAKNDETLNLACISGNLDMVKYLLTSPDLKEHAKLHTPEELPFVQAALNHRLEIIKYFILDLKMEKTEKIIKFLSHPNLSNLDEQVNDWIKIRGFKNLVEDLPINESKVKNKPKL